ncbi:hypothetical protein C8Q76DRAFT_713760 [Earliella scabrosa]|nr:hypothetical protein C8Q76DRAFT_713760 [Earliella scabrosa]
MPDGAHMLELSASSAINDLHRFSLTAVNANRTVRFASNSNVLRTTHYLDAGGWIERMVACPTSVTVRELWISGAFLKRGDWLTHYGVNPEVVFNALPSLQTIVMVTVNSPSQGMPHVPDLYPLPNIVENPTFDYSHLKTLRLVHCIAPNRQVTEKEDVAALQHWSPKKLKLSRILGQLASGAYCYFEEFVLQTTPHFELDPAEVALLSEYFATVSVEQIAEPPQMPLPDYCTAPDDGPGGSCTWTTPLY